MQIQQSYALNKSRRSAAKGVANIGLAAILVSGCGGVEVGEFSEASTQQCPTSTVEGVDVYAGNGTINWSQVKTSGRVFAFMKATQGNYNKQSTFNSNWANTKASGLARSPYHFFDATVDGVAQAHWFLDEIAQAGGIGPGDLPPMLDIECPTSNVQASASATCLGSASGWAPSGTISQRAFDFLDTVEAATGMRPLIYSYPSWFASVGFTDPKLATYPLFIASYSSNTCATVPAPWTKAVFWQYSATTKVPGIGGGSANVDVDRFIGTGAELAAYAAGDMAGDGGTDGGGSVAPVDFAAPVDLAADAGTGTASGHPGTGCGCQLGGKSDRPRGPWLISILALLAMCWDGRRQNGNRTPR